MYKFYNYNLITLKFRLSTHREAAIYSLFWRMYCIIWKNKNFFWILCYFLLHKKNFNFLECFQKFTEEALCILKRTGKLFWGVPWLQLCESWVLYIYNPCWVVKMTIMVHEDVKKLYSDSIFFYIHLIHHSRIPQVVMNWIDKTSRM